MPRGSACLLCHQKKIRCYFTPGATECALCACSGTQCLKYTSNQGHRSDLAVKKRKSALHSPARSLRSEIRRPALTYPVSVSPERHRESNEESYDNNIETLFKNQLGRDILNTNPDETVTETDNQVFDGEMWYVGEANSGWLLSNYPQCRHFPVYPISSPSGSSLPVQRLADAPRNSIQTPETLYLESIGALSPPESPHLEGFLNIFFNQVAPRLPVLGFMNFSSEVVSSLTQSSLLIQSMLFASARFLGPDMIHGLGYKDAHEAQHNFYRKAKSLYDFNYEPRGLPRLQSAILLGSDWDVFVNEKDPDEWIGRALRIAHRMGLHRHIQTPNVNERTRALYRRIWWTIYNLDWNVTIATGRPSRISDHDSDVACLTESDFRSFTQFEEDDLHSLADSYHKQRPWINYQIQSCELWKIAGEFTSSTYSTSQTPRFRQNSIDYNSVLDDWARTATSTSYGVPVSSSPWDLNLELLCCFVRCLVNQPKGQTRAPSLKAPGQIMCNAAWKTNQLAEQLVLQYPTYPYPYFCPLALKLSSYVLLLQAATSTSPASRNFAIHRVRSAQLTLEEIHKQIPSASRVLRTITNAQAILDKLQARGACRSESESQVHKSHVPAESTALLNTQDVPQQRAVPDIFENGNLGTPCFDEGDFDDALLYQEYALDVVDWMPELMSDMSSAV